MTKKNILLGEFLVERGVITDEQLRLALQYQHENGFRLGHALIELGFISERKMIQALSEQLGVQYVNLPSYRLDEDALELVPPEMARNLLALPLFRIQNRLTVAMSNPLDIFAIDALTRATKMKIEPVVSFEQEIKSALDKYYSPENALSLPDGTLARADADEVTVVSHKQEKDNLILAIRALLEKLARQQAIRAYIIGSKLRVELPSHYEDWEIPAQLEAQNFTRLLCNLADDIDPHNRKTTHHCIETLFEGKPVRFHLLSGHTTLSQLLTIFVQMERKIKMPTPSFGDAPEIFYQHLARQAGIHLICAWEAGVLDQIYYFLWRQVCSIARYPISIETRPSVLVPDTCQLVCTNTSEQLTSLRFAAHSRADYIFLKDIVEPESLNYLAFTSLQDRTIIFAQTTARPWLVHRSLLAANNNKLFTRQIRTIYLTCSLDLIRSAANSKTFTAYPTIHDKNGASSDKNSTVGYLWQSEADRERKNRND
ncbi:MAG: hypothetical protein ACE5I1_24705, partial [bacterium]